MTESFKKSLLSFAFIFVLVIVTVPNLVSCWPKLELFVVVYRCTDNLSIERNSEHCCSISVHLSIGSVMNLQTRQHMLHHPS